MAGRGAGGRLQGRRPGQPGRLTTTHPIHPLVPACLQGLLDEGNKRRKTESTDANSVSSRSHAVLEINVRRSPRNHYRVQQLCAKLALVDLAGSERAAGARGRVWGAVRTVWGRQYTAGGPGGQRVVSKCKGGWGGGGSTRAAIRRPKYDWGGTKATWTHWESLGVGLSRQRQCQKSSASPPPSPIKTPTMSARSCATAPTSTARFSLWPTASMRWASRQRARLHPMCPTVTASSHAC